MDFDDDSCIRCSGGVGGGYGRRRCLRGRSAGRPFASLSCRIRAAAASVLSKDSYASDTRVGPARQ